MYKRITRRTAAAVLAVLIIILSLSGCGENVYRGADTMIIGSALPQEAIGAFFGTDSELNALIFDRLIPIDSEGRFILSGGEDGIADCEVRLAGDNAEFSFSIKEDMYFSDGERVDADDAIFSMYVLSDPTYDGASRFCELPIVGMKEYHSGMVEKWRLIYDDVISSIAALEPANSDFYSEEDMKLFIEAMTAAGESFAQRVVDYCLATFAESLQDYFNCEKKDFEQNSGLAAAMAMYAWGVGELDGETGEFVLSSGKSFDLSESFPSCADFWDQLSGGDLTMLAVDDVTFEDVLCEKISADYSQLQKYSDNGYAVRSISGINKTGELSLTVTMTHYDAAVLEALSIYIAPLHHYGDEEKYDYESESYGFTKGDLSLVRQSENSPMGSGSYAFDRSEDNAVFLKASDNYRLGKSKIKNIIIRRVENDILSAVVSGEIDIATVEPTAEDYLQIRACDDVFAAEYPGGMYGYIGINAERVAVEYDCGSYESKMLRRGFAILFSVYRDQAVEEYFSGSAFPVEYPLSLSSWAYPEALDNAYTLDTDGRTIYADSMSEDERISAAIDAAAGCFRAAGAVDSGKIYSFVFCSPDDDHPVCELAETVADALNEFGIKLTIKRVAQEDIFFEKLSAGEYDMWAASWKTCIVPDMSCYYSGNIGELNYYNISDSRLDELIVKSRSLDDENHENIYAECCEIIFDWAVEIPLYSMKKLTLASSERVDSSTFSQTISAYEPWTSGVVHIEMYPESNK